MFKLIDKKIIAILCLDILLIWPYGYKGFQSLDYLAVVSSACIVLFCILGQIRKISVFWVTGLKILGSVFLGGGGGGGIQFYAF